MSDLGNASFQISIRENEPNLFKFGYNFMPLPDGLIKMSGSYQPKVSVLFPDLGIRMRVGFSCAQGPMPEGEFHGETFGGGKVEGVPAQYFEQEVVGIAGEIPPGAKSAPLRVVYSFEAIA